MTTRKSSSLDGFHRGIAPPFMSNSPSHSPTPKLTLQTRIPSLSLLPRSFLEEEPRKGVRAHRTTSVRPSVRPTIFRVLEVFEKEKMGRLTDGRTRTDGRTGTTATAQMRKLAEGREGGKGERRARARVVVSSWKISKLKLFASSKGRRRRGTDGRTDDGSRMDAWTGKTFCQPSIIQLVRPLALFDSIQRREVVAGRERGSIEPG